MDAGDKKSKIKFFLYNKRESGKNGREMDWQNRMEAIKFYTKNSWSKTNYKNKYRNRKCNNQEENQVHVLQECPTLEQLNVQKATMKNIFYEDIKH